MLPKRMEGIRASYLDPGSTTSLRWTTGMVEVRRVLSRALGCGGDRHVAAQRVGRSLRWVGHAVLERRGTVGHGMGGRRASGNLTHRDRGLSLSLGQHVRGCDLVGASASAAVVESRDLALDPTAVGGATDVRQDGSDRIHQTNLPIRRCVFQRRLDDIVGIRVAKKAVHLIRSQKFLDD